MFRANPHVWVHRRDGWLCIANASREGGLELSGTNAGEGLSAAQREGSGIGLALTRQVVQGMDGARLSVRLPPA